MKNILTWIDNKWHYLLMGLIGTILLLIFALIFSITQLNQKETAPDNEVNLLEELMAEDTNEVSQTSVETSSAEASEPSQTSALPKEIIVDIKGEVNTPGVYQMEEGSRIIDVINQAGGLLAQAETTAVNFAQIVTDQMIIYIPKVGEEAPILPSPEPESLNELEATTEMIDINTANKEALMTLNGIGASKAENIITYREEHGPFRTIEEIKNVSGIGEATFNNLKHSIRISP